MIGKAIYNLLSNDPTVSGLVSTKIFPYLAIEDINEPYIVYSQEGLEPTDDKDGVSRLDTIQYDIEMWDTNAINIKALADAVRDVLDRYTGTVEGLNIQSVKYMGEDTQYMDEKSRIYLTMQSYSFRVVK